MTPAVVGDPAMRAARDATVVRESHTTPERFGAIFDAYFAEIHAYVARRIGPENASDVVAETFLAAFRKRDRYDPARASVRGWLYGFATKLVYEDVVLGANIIYPTLPAGTIASTTTVRTAGWTEKSPA
ncbi:MAG TPA: sigma factor [Actinoallomurus sp.]|jgi:hypothetical protein